MYKNAKLHSKITIIDNVNGMFEYIGFLNGFDTLKEIAVTTY